MTKRQLDAVIAACREAAPDLGEAAYDVTRNAGLKAAVRRARDCAIPENYVRRAIDAAKNGSDSFDFRTYDTDWDSEAYLTVAGQNSNNSVRLTNDFVQRVLDDGAWDLIRRTDGRVHKTLPARALWDKIGTAAWASADPGVQYDTTINEWHTCPAGGRINASNPCSEYMFLDDTACNLASLNLLAFRREDGHFDTALFTHCTRIWTVVLEISVLMAQFPSREIARLSYDYRTLGLGLRQSRRPADGGRASLRQRRGPLDRRRDQRRDDRRRLPHLGRDGGAAGAVPRLCRQPRAHAAGDPQPSPRGDGRRRGVRGADGRTGAVHSAHTVRTPVSPVPSPISGTRRWPWARRTATATRR